LRGEHLTPLEFLGERIGACRWAHMQALDARLACVKVQRSGDDGGGDQGEANGAADRRHVEETAAH
jgi:hypothetical protein